METAELKKLIEKHPSRGLLQCVNFGKAAEGCAWIEMDALIDLCGALRNQNPAPFDWIENISAMQMD